MASESDLAEQLLRRASDDEAAAKAMLPVESVTDVIVGFHAQQGVEKALKAVLAARGAEFPFIHDIGGLAKLCKEAGAQPQCSGHGSRSSRRSRPKTRERARRSRSKSASTIASDAGSVVSLVCGAGCPAPKGS